jgi:uncharacterized protein with von Willebrand factor type A (vWA) domain
MLNVAPSAIERAGTLLSARLAGFAGFLHANGYGVGGGDAARIIEAADRVGVMEPGLLRWSLKALLCARGDEWRRFDGLFDAYFLPPNTRSFARQSPPTSSISGPDGRADASWERCGVDEDHSRNAGNEGEGHGASREESLAATDFRELARADQARAMEALMRRFARRLRHLQLRREARRYRGRRLDLQGTIRRSVASGGTPIRLAWKDRRRVRPRLVLLLDVSRSMSAYSFFYLRLARALCAELADVHCFIFHTRMTRVSEALLDPDPWRSQERLHLLAAGWGGGTRIGECLREFERRDGARLVHSRTAIIVVSDGYDTGEPELLAAALSGLRRRARRVVWINPLLGQPDYRPISRAMQAALPHLDLFAAGADLAGVERMLPKLIETLR